MVDGVPIFKHWEEYRAQAREMQTNMDATPKEGVYFDGENLYFDVNEDDLLDEEEDICMVDTIKVL